MQEPMLMSWNDEPCATKCERLRKQARQSKLVPTAALPPLFARAGGQGVSP